MLEGRWKTASAMLRPIELGQRHIPSWHPLWQGVSSLPRPVGSRRLGLPKAMHWTVGRTIAQGCRGVSDAEAGGLLHVALYLALRQAVVHGRQRPRLVQQDGLHSNRA